MKVIEVPIDQVKPYENNPRINDDAVQETANSIKEFGWQQPIVVDKKQCCHCRAYTFESC